MDASRRTPRGGDQPSERPTHEVADRREAGAGPERLRASSYEYREVVLPRGTSRGQARALLTEEAEYGKWELAGVRLYMGGLRRVVLRRRIIRMQRTA
ncbi:DUF5703 family protein [uncultured Pseudokineococcus sp.]|uniref:DUF5703 family protein n=1 Tax=uncultured Pseudokineococcus sp. TaxID=1642928 RepID=UPI00261570F0|nr:DUF5703 family protein [uncultured Pseudokineococcus sp.]